MIRRWLDYRWLLQHSRPGHTTTSWGVDADSLDRTYWTCTCGKRRDVRF